MPHQTQISLSFCLQTILHHTFPCKMFNNRLSVDKLTLFLSFHHHLTIKNGEMTKRKKKNVDLALMAAITGEYSTRLSITPRFLRHWEDKNLRFRIDINTPSYNKYCRSTRRNRTFQFCFFVATHP